MQSWINSSSVGPSYVIVCWRGAMFLVLITDPEDWTRKGDRDVQRDRCAHEVSGESSRI